MKKISLFLGLTLVASTFCSDANLPKSNNWARRFRTAALACAAGAVNGAIHGLYKTPTAARLASPLVITPATFVEAKETGVIEAVSTTIVPFIACSLAAGAFTENVAQNVTNTVASNILHH